MWILKMISPVSRECSWLGCWKKVSGSCSAGWEQVHRWVLKYDDWRWEKLGTAARQRENRPCYSLVLAWKTYYQWSEQMNQCTRIFSEYSEEVLCVVQGLLVYSNLCGCLCVWVDTTFHTLIHNSADMLRHCFRSSCNKRGNSDLLQPCAASVHTDWLIIEMDFLSITGAHKHMHMIFFLSGRLLLVSRGLRKLFDQGWILNN